VSPEVILPLRIGGCAVYLLKKSTLGKSLYEEQLRAEQPDGCCNTAILHMVFVLDHKGCKSTGPEQFPYEMYLRDVSLQDL